MIDKTRGYMRLRELYKNKYSKIMDDTTEEICKIFEAKFRSSPENGLLIVHACIYSPITFVMGIFSKLDDMGVDLSEVHPKFMGVYMNYLNNLKDIEHLWGTIPFKEFEAKFIESYLKSGHGVWGSNEQN